jgi:hypothetical protein
VASFRDVEVDREGSAERISLHPDGCYLNIGNSIDGNIDIPVGDATH